MIEQMITVRTSRFKKAYKKLDEQSQKAINQALILLVDDLAHPSLRVKKMKGYHNPDLWELSANRDLRITFEFIKPNTLILRNCDHHDATLNKP